MTPVEFALVGCGGIAENGYLPALSLVDEARCVALVDVRRAHAERLARRWGIATATDRFPEALEAAEAVVLAVPNHLHVPLSLEALERGRAVLCEKPLGRNVAEVERLVDAARRAGAPLVAGLQIRQYPTLRALREALPWDRLGPIREARASYGFTMNWPAATAHAFDRAKAGGGVLLDQGVHLLDAVCWVLSLSKVAVRDYADDGASGMEAEAHGVLEADLPEGRGRIALAFELSRLVRLPNGVELRGERATLRIPLSDQRPPILEEDGVERPALGAPPASRAPAQSFADQLTAFARRVRGLPSNAADGTSQLEVLGLIDACYRMRRPLTRPWRDYAPWPER